MIEFSYHTKQKWGGAKAFKDSGYFYTTIRVKDDGENLYLKANGKGKPTVYLTVRRFREYTAVEALRLLQNMGWLTRHSHEGILWAYRKNNLNLGFLVKILR